MGQGQSQKGGKSSPRKKGGKGGKGEEKHKAHHKNELKFADEVFDKKSKKQLEKRFEAIANGRDHITKQDFLDQPEIGSNPLIERVVDVVLEENGHATRRCYEGNFIETDFSAAEKDRIIGLHFDPAVPPDGRNRKAMGAIIEEVVPGGPAAMKGNLHHGMRLIAVRDAKTPRGQWNYMMGRPFKYVNKYVTVTAKRPMTLLFQNPEDPKVEAEYAAKLVEVDTSYGGGGYATRDRIEKASGKDSSKDSGSDSDDSEDDEAKAAQEAENWKIRQYEVEFNHPTLGIGKGKKGFGLKLGPAHPQKNEGTKVIKVQENSFSDEDGRIKMGHYLIGIGKKDTTKMTLENTTKALKSVLTKTKRPIHLKFEVKVKIKKEKVSLESDDVHTDDRKPSHGFMQRQYLTHFQLTFEDYLNILAVCSPKIAHRTELLERLVFRIYDVDNDGFVGQDDLYYMFKFVTHSNISDSQLEVIVDHAFKKLDDSGDRKVNLAEFTKFMGEGAASEFLEIDFG
jgi:hypothetical protein